LRHERIEMAAQRMLADLRGRIETEDKRLPVARRQKTRMFCARSGVASGWESAFVASAINRPEQSLPGGFSPRSRHARRGRFPAAGS